MSQESRVVTHNFSQLLDDYYFSMSILTYHWWFPVFSLYLCVVQELHLERTLSNQLFVMFRFNTKSDFLRTSFDVIYDFWFLCIENSLEVEFPEKFFWCYMWASAYAYIHFNIHAHVIFYSTESIDFFTFRFNSKSRFTVSSL